MRKIKILYIIDYLSIGGGTENQLRKMITHIDKSKFDITLVVLKHLDWEGFPAFADPGCRNFCLDIDKLLSFNTFKKIFRLTSYIRKNNIDIVHTFFFDSNLIGVAGGLLGGCKSIFISRRDLGFWYTKTKLFLLRLLKPFCHVYVVNSNAIKDVVHEQEKVPREKIEVIYNGFFRLPDTSPSPITKQKLGIPDDAFVVGIVANLREVKRLDLFINVAEKLQDKPVHFLMMGNGPLKKQLLAQAKQAGIDQRFQIQHTLDSIFDYIKLFDVGVLTSSSEGLSNTLIEYQLSGKPAVAFDVGGNNEVIVENETGHLVPFGDIELMARVIQHLLDNTALRQTFGETARKRASELFAGDRMIQLTEKLYSSNVNP